MIWFGPEMFGRVVTFSEPHSSTWVLEKMISEHASLYSREECDEPEAIPEVRGVFIARSVMARARKRLL